MYIKVLFLFIFLNNDVTQSANILAITHMPSFSHQIVFRSLWKKLSLRGHQVTLLTTDPINDSKLTNLTEIGMQISYNVWGNFDLIKFVNVPAWAMWHNFSNANAVLIDQQLSLPEVRKLIENKNTHFDLLMIEGFHSAHFAFAERFKCPFITVLSLDASSFVHEEIGNPSHYVLHPDYSLPFVEHLTFIQRLESTFYTVYFRILNYYYIIPAQQRIVEKHFGKNYSQIQQIFKNYSAVFLNTNNILHPIRPLLPNVVAVGGKTHITKSKPLPNDLQSLLDKSTIGVIYFSLGSNAKSKHISTHILHAIVDVFKELPYTILWKFENEDLLNKPDNVIISKWFPQQDVLRHSNVKLFITQGGLQSLEEALYANVPIIGIPVLGDQKSNVNRIVSKGFGILLEYNSITKESFKSAILEVITNKKYYDNVKRYASLVVDQPQTGLERAIWWTEYVLRHKGTSHLRNPAFDLPWYQYYLLDVIAFCLSIILIFAFVIFKIFLVLMQLFKWVVLRSKEKQM